MFKENLWISPSSSQLSWPKQPKLWYEPLPWSKVDSPADIQGELKKEEEEDGTWETATAFGKPWVP